MPPSDRPPQPEAAFMVDDTGSGPFLWTQSSLAGFPPPSRLFVLLLAFHLSSHTPFINFTPSDVIFYRGKTKWVPG